MRRSDGSRDDIPVNDQRLLIAFLADRLDDVEQQLSPIPGCRRAG
jgi:hypothetical protein